MDDTFSILGKPFHVRTASPFCAELIHTIFGDCIASGADMGPTYVLDVDLQSDRPSSSITRDGRALLRNADPRSVVSLLSWHVMNDAVSSTTDLFVAHAGSVVAPNGRAIVLPAGSGSGKTTLTAGLVQAGCAYLSDEMAAFDPASELVIPVPRALSMKIGSMELLRLDVPRLSPQEREVLDGAYPLRSEALRHKSLGVSSPLGMVIAPIYRPDALPELTPISRAEAVSELIHQGFNVEAFGGARAIQLLARMIEEASCYRMTVRTLDEAVSTVLEAVATVSR